ncbi:coiled-coil domain-containing protein 122-like [Scomber scombrus]|uniref:Coiled-coil domain-containing protein 122-like n=1 Tax=Scomber scombrus TaxID=13677 RepID=A0AAV1PQP2_SCOSC
MFVNCSSGTQCSLTKAVEDVTHHGHAQTEALKEKEKTLSSLQVSLSDVEKKAEEAEQELRSKVRGLHIVEGEVEHLELQTRLLHDRCASTSTDNSELQVHISEEEESACKALEGFSTYRNKIKSHRAAVSHAESQTEAHKDLEVKRKLVRMLTQTKEELKKDLENPNGNTVQMAKREIDALKDEIAAVRTTVAERRERLGKEIDIQTQIKKDIEIQNRRYEAIIKRLRCQLSKAQAVHRQMSGDIYHMERQIAKLKQQRESS